MVQPAPSHLLLNKAFVSMIKMSNPVLFTMAETDWETLINHHIMDQGQSQVILN